MIKKRKLENFKNEEKMKNTKSKLEKNHDMDEEGPGEVSQDWQETGRKNREVRKIKMEKVNVLKCISPKSKSKIKKPAKKTKNSSKKKNVRRIVDLFENLAEKSELQFNPINSSFKKNQPVMKLQVRIANPVLGRVIARDGQD